MQAKYLKSHFEKNHYDFKVKIIVEEELLGTGGAIKNSLSYLPNEFFVLMVTQYY